MKADSWSLDERPPPTTTRDKWWRFVERRLPGVVMFLMVATLVVVVLAPNMVVTVPSGHVGVLWKRFAHGTVRDPRQLRGEGLHLLLPWDKLFLYDLRIQSITDTYNAISKDGVTLNATLNIRFRLQRNSVPILHKAIGPDYTKLLGPQIASQMRGVIAEYTAEQVYSSARQEIQDKIRETAVEKLSHKMMDAETAGEAEESNIASMQDAVVLYDTLLYGIELPASVVQAINRKTEQYYIAQEYEFRIDRERKESERKAIEAAGISEFQRIVSQGISDSYLRWRGVEATLQLAQSNNSKIVIIGGGKDGLPIILGNVDTPAPARARATSPAENRAVTEERSTAAAPAVPLEKMPAADLALPAEKMPSADSAKTQSAAPGTPSAAPPQEPGALFPRSLSELEALVSRALRATEATTEPPAKLPSEQPAVAQPR
jgi:regulator of protease activity HflC (stomatin/prohibitin superfamily)